MEYWEEVEEKIMKATPEEMKAIADNMEMEIYSALSTEALQKYTDYLQTEDLEEEEKEE